MKIEMMRRFAASAIGAAAVIALCACAAIDESADRPLAQESCPAAGGNEKRTCADDICEIHISLDQRGRPQIDPKVLVLEGHFERPVQLIWDVPDRTVFDPSRGDHVAFDDAPAGFTIASAVGKEMAPAADAEATRGSRSLSLTVTPREHNKRYRYHALFRDAQGEKLHLCDPWVQMN